MRRALLDLKHDDGRDAFLDLARYAGVVVESFRPGVVDRLGIGYEAVRAVNERVVYCSTSGYGQTGPRRDWAGHDLNYLAVSGYLHCSGRNADGAPALPGATVADIAAGGMHAALAVMAALLRRQRTGHGEHLDVSVADGALGMMSLYADEHLATGAEPGPGHYILTGRYACYGIYACADGKYLSVAAIEPAFWANLCRALGLDRFIDAQTDDELQDQVRAALAAVLASTDRGRVGTAAPVPTDCCVAPVNRVSGGRGRRAVPGSGLSGQGRASHRRHDGADRRGLGRHGRGGLAPPAARFRRDSHRRTAGRGGLTTRPESPGSPERERSHDVR